MTDDASIKLLRDLLVAVSSLDALPHGGPAGRVMLAAAVAGKGCSDDVIALAASMPVADVREILPSMMEQYEHCPPLLSAKTNRHPVDWGKPSGGFGSLRNTSRRAEAVISLDHRLFYLDYPHPVAEPPTSASHKRDFPKIGENIQAADLAWF